MSAERLVVAAAIVSNGRLLSCRRTAPPALAGRWEFPGGKVEYDESDAEALERECREELGLDVVVRGRLGDDVVIGPPVDGTAALRIRVYWAELARLAEPALRIHDAVRWLGPDELFEVPWIDADRALVALAARRLAAAERSRQR